MVSAGAAEAASAGTEALASWKCAFFVCLTESLAEAAPVRARVAAAAKIRSRMTDPLFLFLRVERRTLGVERVTPEHYPLSNKKFSPAPVNFASRVRDGFVTACDIRKGLRQARDRALIAAAIAELCPQLRSPSAHPYRVAAHQARRSSRPAAGRFP